MLTGSHKVFRLDKYANLIQSNASKSCLEVKTVEDDSQTIATRKRNRKPEEKSAYDFGHRGYKSSFTKVELDRVTIVQYMYVQKLSFVDKC